MIALQDEKVRVIFGSLLTDQLKSQESRITSLEETVSKQTDQIGALEAKIATLESANLALSQTTPAQPAQEPPRQSSRDKNIVIRGIAEGINEPAIVARLVNEELELPFSPHQIASTSRLGRIQNDKPRALLVKLHDGTAQNAILAARFKLKVNQPSVFIQEDLDPATSTLATNLYMYMKNTKNI